MSTVLPRARCPWMTDSAAADEHFPRTPRSRHAHQIASRSDGVLSTDDMVVCAEHLRAETTSRMEDLRESFRTIFPDSGTSAASLGSYSESELKVHDGLRTLILAYWGPVRNVRSRLIPPLQTDIGICISAMEARGSDAGLWEGLREKLSAVQAADRSVYLGPGGVICF